MSVAGSVSSYVDLIASIRIHHVNLVVTVGLEEKTIWLPSEDQDGCRSSEESLVNRTGLVPGIHRVYLAITVSIRYKGDSAAVRRPRGGEVVGRIVRQARGGASIGVYHVDLRGPSTSPGRYKGDF